MNIFEIADEFDSDETCDFSSEDESESPDNILNFCDKITEELRECFRRNSRSEDYCEDIYEDKFAPSRSGCYSYYADILAAAGSDNKADGVSGFKELANASDRNAEESRIVYPSNWKCSGQWDPSVGVGPLEELFNVLECNHGLSNLQNVNGMIYPHEWSTNPSSSYDELLAISSADGDYSNFVDMIHRWNSDPFAYFQSTNNYDFVSPDYQAFY